jgi:hypothetical protein
VLYLVWGVSYAAHRIMALSLTPLLAAGARFVLAGTFLTFLARSRALARARGARVPGSHNHVVERVHRGR